MRPPSALFKHGGTARRENGRVEPVTCHRCGALGAPDRLDIEGWIVLDAREDGWTLLVCPECQSAAERDRVKLLRLDP